MAQTNDTTKTTGTNATDTSKTQREQASRDGGDQSGKNTDSLNKQEDANSRGSQGDTATRGQQTQGQGTDKMDPNATKKGGDAVGQDREQMSQIGKKAGEASGSSTKGSTGSGNR